MSKKSNMSFQELYLHLQKNSHLTEDEACAMIGVQITSKKNGTIYISIIDKIKFNQYKKNN